MASFALRRLLIALPVLWLVATLTFFMIRLAPGDPLGEERGLDPQVRAQMAAYYGFDQPLPAQYLTFLGNLLRFDLGYSRIYAGTGVGTLIRNHFPHTLQYAIPGILFALGCGIFLGTVAALYQNRPLDHSAMATAMLGICLPTFVLAPLLALFFGSWLNWLPSVGWPDSSQDFGRPSWTYRILPTLAIGIFYTGYIARLTRSGMIATLNEPYLLAARAKGLSTFRLIFTHTFRHALLPVVAFLGPAAAGILTGSFVIESIFGIPGLGDFFIRAALNYDYSLILGLVIFYAALILFFNLAVDLLQAWMNPRIRYSSGGTL
ncbi:MAG: ABC transporter permease [Puniceicoccaceae bacterium]